MGTVGTVGPLCPLYQLYPCLIYLKYTILKFQVASIITESHLYNKCKCLAKNILKCYIYKPFWLILYCDNLE